MRIRTLGAISAELDAAVAPPELLWRKHLALLVYLAKSPRRTRSREHLIGLLWGDRPEASARHSLNEAIRLVRRHLGDGAITTVGQQVTLAAESVHLDEDGQGAFLDGFAIPGCSTFEEWLAAERGARQRSGVDRLTARADELLAAGAVAEGQRLAEEAVALAPTSEPAVRALMRALALAGQRALALQACDALGRRLRDELDAEPEPETRGLRDRIHRGLGTRRRSEASADDVPTRPPLVGREAEMGVLGESVRTACIRRRPAIVIVEGESGSGKTRILEEIADRARLAGLTVMLTRSIPSEASESWSALAGLVRAGLMDSPGVLGASPSAFAALAGVNPERDDRAPTDLTPGRALPEVLRAACEESPVLLILDDAQWSDPATLGAVAASTRDLKSLPLVVLLAVRLHADAPSLDEMRARIGREVEGVCVRLGPLEPNAIASLAAIRLPHLDAEDRDRLTRRVLADSAGSPLLAVEMLHAVAHGLNLGRAARGWPEPGRTLDDTIPADLPDAVVSAIRVNFRRLSADAQSALAATAALADRVSEDAIRRATGLPPERANAALDELEWQRWLVADSRGYAFSARLIRDVVARDFLTAGQRERIVRLASTTASPST